MFDESGKFVRSFGKEGRLEGELSEPRAIAFTPSTSPGEAGNLLVAEMENQRVTMFSDDGQYLCIYGDSCEVIYLLVSIFYLHFFLQGPQGVMAMHIAQVQMVDKL